MVAWRGARSKPRFRDAVAGSLTVRLVQSSDMDMTKFGQILSAIADRGLPWVKLPTNAAPLRRASALAHALIGERGEAAGIALARELVELYERLTPEETVGFLDMLCREFAPDETKLQAAAAAYAAAPSDARLLALSALVEAPRQELLRRMNMAPHGTAVLVRMRQALLGLLRERPDLQVLDADLKHLLSSWFNRGFLKLERIDWRTPAVILEKLMEYEAVHAIQGWDDLRRRLASDRRCFAFFHPALGDEPLIFVEIALTTGIARSVQALLARAPETARSAPPPDTAIFYSISNCQPGLRGISFGNFLIKQVVEELQAELPGLTCFSTLSPIPGFRSWLDRQIANGVRNLLNADERAGIMARLTEADRRLGAKGAFKAMLADPRWPENADRRAALEAPLGRLCAEFLLGVRSAKGPTDAVARFHLGNGARIEQVDFLGDVSPKGLKQSYGMMVNYRYELSQIEANHEAFVRSGAVARSAAIDQLVAAPSVAARARQLPQLLAARLRHPPAKPPGKRTRS
jgi:malonyl-CoA decarboxylase